MSTTGAIATVTYMLKQMIQAEVSIDTGVTGSKVTAAPPDKARAGGTGNQVNVFLYRISIDPAWRNMDAPGTRPGEPGQAPLPLILSYLITAYGDTDDDILAHRLLGIAMGVLNDTPILSRADIAKVKDKVAGGTGLDQQVELIRFSPDPRPQDEISRMWSTFGTGYRPSVSYDAAVVLIDSTAPAVAPLPVLARGAGDLGPTATTMFPPQIDMVVAPGLWGAARPGDAVTLMGRNLTPELAIQVTGVRLAAPVPLQPALNEAGQLTVQIPDPAAAPAGPPSLPAGTVALAPLYDAGVGTPVPGPAAPLALAPKIVSDKPLKAKLDANGAAELQVNCQPEVLPGQTVALILGSKIVPAASPQQPTSQLTFALTGLTPQKTYKLRLRIDSIDSIPVAGQAPPVPDNLNEPAPMEFDPAQTLVTS